MSPVLLKFNSSCLQQKLAKVPIFEVASWNKVNFFTNCFCVYYNIIKIFKTSVACCQYRRVIGLYTEKMWSFNIYSFFSIKSRSESPVWTAVIRFAHINALYKNYYKWEKLQKIERTLCFWLKFINFFLLPSIFRIII